MRNFIYLLISFVFVTCQSSTNSKTIVTDKQKSGNEEIKSEKVFDTESIILYMPNEEELEALKTAKTDEELVAIDYDKAEAMAFLSDKNVPVFVRENKQYKFKKADGTIKVINKNQYQNWGLILFTPEKSPMIIFLHEIADKYNTYFE